MAVSGAWAKDVTLVVDGQQRTLRTSSDSVGDLLSDTGVPMALGLQVHPPPATELADGMTVVVSPPPGVPEGSFSMSVGPSGVGVWVVERADASSFGKAAASSDEASAFADGVGTPGVSVRAVVSGKVHDVSTNATTTGALLTAMGIQPDADDRVAPSPSTPLLAGMTVRFDRVEHARQRIVTVIPSTIEIVYTSSLTPGNVRVIQEGRAGLSERWIRLTVINGRVVARRVGPSRAVIQPIPERRLSAPLSMFDGTLTEPGTGATSQRGSATWYDPPWSGLTAAHPWLPFGTRVIVTDRTTGRSVTVVIDDRGPFAPGRIIDLSPEAFERLAPLGRGVLDVALSW
jgi:hypothetical protein